MPSQKDRDPDRQLKGSNCPEVNTDWLLTAICHWLGSDR